MKGAESLPHFAAVPLFSCLSAEERRMLAPLCRVQVYEKGETIFSEGEPALNLSFVIFGRAKVFKAAQGRDVILGLFGPGEPVGIVAAFERSGYPASAAALQPSTVLHVPEREFFGVVDSHPEITRNLLAGLMLRQLEITRRLADLTGSVEFRMARLFLTLAERVGKPSGTGVEIPVGLSRQDIADLAATTVETAIRTMSRWGKDGVVLTQPEGFRIPDLEALRQLSRS